MRRNVFDTLRRSLDNTLVNWGLLVVRIVEACVFVALTIATVIAVFVPILVSVGIEVSHIESPDDVESAILALMDQWMLLVWVFVALTVLFGVFVVLHAMVEAGCARVYVDGERAAGPLVDGPRARFRVFSVDRWFAGAKSGGWTVFWIYNLAWGLAGIVLLVPLIPTAIVMLVFRETPQVLIATGCIGLVLTLMLMLLVAIVTGMWTNRAIADWAANATGASASLASAWRALKADLGRHILVALAILVVAMAGSSVFASFGFFAALGESVHRVGVVNFFTLPARFAGSILNMIFSSAVSSWYLASYVGLAAEEKRN